jgi:GNAT superfamily N-acetyltransferase
MPEFTLRSMEEADGPAIDALIREQAQTTSISMTTSYRHDVYRSLLAQHPSLFGVVAEIPEMDGLAGFATAFVDGATVAGRPYPTAHLENLKVRADLRRQGLGARLAAWRIEEAERRFGGEGVLTAAIDSSNAASIATARHWASQVVGPVILRIARPSATPPPEHGLVVRPLRDDDAEEVLGGIAAFHAGHDLVPVISASRLAASLADTSLGEPIRQYRVAVTPDGSIVAGAGVSERFKLMTDHIDHIPLPLAVVGRIAGMIPPDRTIRSVELFLAWHAPGQVDAARRLWDAIRYEWRDRVTSVVGLVDPRSSLIEAFHVGRMPGPRVELVVPVRSPVPIAPERLIYLWR